MKNCTAAHAVFQPTDAQWQCPRCGARVDDEHDDFVIENSDETAHEDCTKLHKGDECACRICGWAGSGQQVSMMLMKKLNRVVCPCCKGQGTIPS